MPHRLGSFRAEDPSPNVCPVVSATSVAQLVELGRPPFPPHAARGEAGFLPATWFLFPGAAAPCLNPVLTGRRTRARWRFTRRSRRAPQCRAPGPRRCCRPRACFGERRGVLALSGLGLARGTQNDVPARATCACAHVSVRVRALRRPGPKGVGKPGKHTARRRLAEPHGRREGRRSGDCAWQSAPDSSCNVRQALPSSGKYALRRFWCWVWEARPFPWGQDVGPWPVGQRRAFLSLLGSRPCGHELRGGLTHWEAGHVGACMRPGGPSADAAWERARARPPPRHGLRVPFSTQ